MNFDLKGKTVLLTIAGSRAYNISTVDSDVDIKGICIPPKEYRDGFLHCFEQADKTFHMKLFYNSLSKEEQDKFDEGKVEGSIYEMRKFFKLASDVNPNILDLLFCRDSEIRLINHVGEKLRENRDLFLSKKARFTFFGYALSQLKRIKLHRGYLLNPVTHKPTRDEFNLPPNPIIPKEQLLAAEDSIKKKIDSWEIDFGNMSEADKIYIQDQMVSNLAEIDIASDNKFLAAARLVGYDENFIFLLQKEREYKMALNRWHKFQEWKTNRNPARAAMEAKFGFDCYTDDTEFLTNNGWKLFDEITNDKLATVYIGENYVHRNFGKIEYQSFKDRFEGNFTGDLYQLYGYHLDTLVTPNHRMLIRKVERKSKKVYKWELCEVANLPDTFDVMVAPEPNYKVYSYYNLFDNIPIKPATFLRLMGWFLSDGSVSFRNGQARAISISQKKGNRLCQGMTKFYKKYKKEANCSLYKYYRGENEFRTSGMIEYILNIRNKFIVNKLYEECGHFKEKRIPRWVFDLTFNLKEILLDALVRGDGTHRKCGFNSIIYYSSLKTLAGDVQELAMSCGFETSLYGPYEDHDGVMYQVHINKNTPNIKTLVRSKNIKKIEVKDRRIVCFTVPNGTLITRRNGHIGIHGNSKHAGHLIRLMRMCLELLETGKINVWRQDGEEIRSIRNGAWSYDQLIEWSENQEKLINKAYIKCNILPHSPNLEKLNQLCVDLIQEGNK